MLSGKTRKAPAVMEKSRASASFSLAMVVEFVIFSIIQFFHNALKKRSRS